MIMTKENVIKALALCSDIDVKSCSKCPYNGMEDCDQMVNNDAISLIKANETKKPKYTIARIYTKRGTLLGYMSDKVTNRASNMDEMFRMRERYTVERDIELVAMFRYEGDKCYCKIKCPVNPLPIKGEFEVPSVIVLSKFLQKDGWKLKQVVYPSMFQ
jgi:hypothetical protein